MEGFFRRYLRAYRPIISALNDLLSGHELSYGLWQVMVYIHDNGPATLVDISAHYQIEKPGITRRVQRLEELGLVTTAPGKDRREKLVELSSKGQEVYRQCRRQISGLEAQCMEGISEQEQHILFQVLPRIQRNIGSKAGGTHA